jgi:hypothetical protein
LPMTNASYRNRCDDCAPPRPCCSTSDYSRLGSARNRRKRRDANHEKERGTWEGYGRHIADAHGRSESLHCVHVGLLPDQYWKTNDCGALNTFCRFGGDSLEGSRTR